MKYQLEIERKLWGQFKRVCLDDNNKSLADKLRELIAGVVNPDMKAEQAPAPVVAGKAGLKDKIKWMDDIIKKIAGDPDLSIYEAEVSEWWGIYKKKHFPVIINPTQEVKPDTEFDVDSLI